MYVMLGRLLDHVVDVVIPESQCGFRKNRSTVDMIFVARLLQEKWREQNQSLYLAFIDLTKAFDTVNRELLWNVLTKAGCPPKFISILKAFNNGMFARVKVGGLLSDPFEVKVAKRQKRWWRTSCQRCPQFRWGCRWVWLQCCWCGRRTVSDHQTLWRYFSFFQSSLGNDVFSIAAEINLSRQRLQSIDYVSSAAEATCRYSASGHRVDCKITENQNYRLLRGTAIPAAPICTRYSGIICVQNIKKISGLKFHAL